MTDEQGIKATQNEGGRQCLQCGDAFTPLTDKEIFCSKECFRAHEDRDWEYSDGGTFRQSRRLFASLAIRMAIAPRPARLR